MRVAEAARAAIATAGVVLAVVVVTIEVLAVTVMLLEALVLVSLPDRLEATLTVGAGVDLLAVTLLVAVVLPEPVATVSGLGFRMNKKAPAPTATAARPISAQGAEDLLFLAEGDSLAGAVSTGMGFMPLSSPVSRPAIFPKAPGSVTWN